MEAPELYYGFAGESNQFAVEDLFDFSKEDEVMSDKILDNSTLTVVDSCNSSYSGGDTQFSGGRSFCDAQFAGELCVPDDDVAELEWLSNFVEDSFSNDSSHITNFHHLTPTDTSSSSMTRPISNPDPPTFPPATSSVPGKARSKRSRAAPCDWSSRLLHLQTQPKSGPARKRDESDVLGRACFHCGSQKTPQWRLGPMGPKTLCNACGVRYKSGRLVPEYRPASSPTFVPTKHSNSHRKVLELQRQKEVAIFGGSNGGDYLMNINGHDYARLI